MVSNSAAFLFFHRCPLGQDDTPRVALVGVKFIRIPQLGAFERLGAVEVAFFDADFDGKLGRTAPSAEFFQELRFVGNPGAAVDTHGPFLAGNEKEQTDVRVLQNIADALEHFVTGPVREVEGVFVCDFDKPRRIALG